MPNQAGTASFESAPSRRRSLHFCKCFGQSPTQYSAHLPNHKPPPADPLSKCECLLLVRFALHLHAWLQYSFAFSLSFIAHYAAILLGFLPGPWLGVAA